MFKKNSNPSQPTLGQEITIIGPEAIVKGNLQSKRAIRIDGKLTGDIETEAKVFVCEHAKITGNIHCQDAEIYGTIEGTITAKGLVDIKETAKIKGDIFYAQIQIEAGAQAESKLHQTTGKSESVVNIKEAKTA